MNLRLSGYSRMGHREQRVVLRANLSLLCHLIEQFAEPVGENAVSLTSIAS